MKKILSIILLISLISCEDDFSLEEQKMVLHSFVMEGKSPKIIVSRSLGAFPQYPFNIRYYDQPVRIDGWEANSKITVNSGNEVFNNFRTKAHYLYRDPYDNSPKLNDSLYYFIDNTLIPMAGKEYEIEIKELEMSDYMKLGYDNIKAKTYIPEKIPVKIEKIKTTESTQGYYNDSTITFEITFKDPSETNYYYISLSTVSSNNDEFFSMDTVDMDYLWQTEFHYYNTPSTLSFDNLKTSLGYKHKLDLFETEEYPEYWNQYPQSVTGGGFLFSDELFNGQTKTITMQYEADIYEYSNTKYIVIELMHLSEDFYRYQLSLEKQAGSQTDVFSEPTQIYSNIENGIGIFAGASMSTSYILIE